MSTKEQIITILSQEGPLLPIELASKTKLDTFLVKGYLEELFKENKVKLVKQKAGSDFIFYLPGQEELLEEKQKEEKEAIIRTSNYKKVSGNPELRQKRQEFLERLRKIEEEERRSREKQSPKTVNTNNTEDKKEEYFTDRELKETVDEDKEVYEELVEEKKNFLDIAEDYLKDNNLEIIDNLGESKKSKKLVVSIPSRLYSVKTLVIIKDKKKLSKSDLALAYTLALDSKMPALVMTKGKLTKTAEEYLNDAGEFLKVKVI